MYIIFSSQLWRKLWSTLESISVTTQLISIGDKVCLFKERTDGRWRGLSPCLTGDTSITNKVRRANPLNGVAILFKQPRSFQINWKWRNHYFLMILSFYFMIYSFWDLEQLSMVKKKYVLFCEGKYETDEVQV